MNNVDVYVGALDLGVSQSTSIMSAERISGILA